jgi:hypothetical protein
MDALHVFVLRRGREVEVVQDRHVLGLFPLATWTRHIAGAGLEPGRRPYPVHTDGHEAWLLTGVRR